MSAVNAACFALSGPGTSSFSSPAKPMTLLSGVLSSCVTFAMNSDFARSRRSSRSRDWRSDSVRASSRSDIN